MVQVGVISIDGTKIAANGSMSANRSHEWLAEQARRIAGDVVADADSVDAAEDAAAVGDARAGELPEQFATRHGRAANIKKALEELQRQDTSDAKDVAAERAGFRSIWPRSKRGNRVCEGRLQERTQSC